MERFSNIETTFEEQVIPSLSEYIAIEALSPDFDAQWKQHGAIDRAAQHLFAWAMARPIRGLTGQIREIDGRTPVIVLEIPASDDCDREDTVLLYGHLDKQPPLGDWSEGLHPFSAVRRGDLLFGRGSVDDGYSI